jgi:hypothetical protein
VRDAHHDLESFLLVIIYSLYRRFTKLHPNDQLLDKEYKRVFGSITLDQISDGRSYMYARKSIALPELTRIVANVDLEFLVDASCRLIHLQNLPIEDNTKSRRGPKGGDLPRMPLGQLITYDEVNTIIEKFLEPLE